MEKIDQMIASLNLPKEVDFTEMVLTLHSSFENELQLANKGIFPLPEIKRYRGWLLWFDENVPKDLCFATHIDNEIENLRFLQSKPIRWFTQKEYDKLKYLLKSKKKAEDYSSAFSL